jgi:hypothetical protein
MVVGLCLQRKEKAREICAVATFGSQPVRLSGSFVKCLFTRICCASDVNSCRKAFPRVFMFFTAPIVLRTILRNPMNMNDASGLGCENA